MSMVRVTWFVVFALLSACATSKADKPDQGYTGTVQKAYPVMLQGQDLPGMRFLGKVGAILGPKLRRSSETYQYVVRTRTGQIMAQSDDPFAVGDCVEVIPQDGSSGPAYRHGRAQVVKSNDCTTLTVAPR